MASRGRILAVGALAVLLVSAATAIMWKPSPPADHAAAAVRGCPSGELAAQQSCYESRLLARVHAGGAGAAMALLDRLATHDPNVRRDGHMYAHVIGIAALGSRQQVGRVFASCTPAFQSGCYHGVIQSYFLATRREGHAIDADTIDHVCADYRGPRGSPWLLFQCTHGLGHGLTMFHGHDLRRALASCDLMRRPAERESCYGGAFMENIVNVTEPHHMAADAGMAQMGAGDGRHYGRERGVGQPQVGAAFPALNPRDLHYPCSSLAEKYLEACYTLQTTAMLYFTRHDVGRTARECERAPARFRRTCFMSLGRDVSTMAGTDLRQAVRLCGLADSQFQPDCNVGVAQSIVNMNGNPVPGVDYCRIVDSAESKAACYSVVGRQATLLPNGTARREAACRGAESRFADSCLGRSAPAGWGKASSVTISAPRRLGARRPTAGRS